MAETGIPYLEGRYSPTLDVWPIEAKEFNRLHRFYENLKEGRFTTTKCKECGHVAYPPRVICPECYGDGLDWIDLPKRGKVLIVVERVGGLPIHFKTPPLVQAWIDMGNESPVKRIFSRILNCPKGRLKEGDEVRLVVFDVPAHPVEFKKERKIVERVFFGFEPIE